MATNSTRLLSNFDKNIAATNAANTVPDYERGAAEWTAGLAKMDAGNEEEDKAKKRRGIAAGLKDLSKRGYLTGELLKEARGRATEAGITDDQFSSFMKKNRIKPSNFATAAPTSSPEEAAQNVMFQNEFGTGLGSLAAMQDDNYKLGSGSSLSKPAGPVNKNKGGSGIDTPAAHKQRMSAKIIVGREAEKQDSIASSYAAATPATSLQQPSVTTLPHIVGAENKGQLLKKDRLKAPWGAKKQLLKKDRLKMWA